MNQNQQSSFIIGADWWAFNDAKNGMLHLYTVPVSPGYKNLYDVPNLLLQKFPAPEFTVTTKLQFRPNTKITGERVGLVVMGLDYASLYLEYTPEGVVLAQNSCKAADKGTAEEAAGHTVKLDVNAPVYLRVKVEKGGVCSFSFSTGNETYTPIGTSFTAKEGKWIGAKVGLFAIRPVANNDGGCVKVDWFRVE